MSDKVLFNLSVSRRVLSALFSMDSGEVIDTGLPFFESAAGSIVAVVIIYPLEKLKCKPHSMPP